ncbi:hypothetical protein GN956_G14900 [Arapaima gigas]
MKETPFCCRRPQPPPAAVPLEATSYSSWNIISGTPAIPLLSSRLYPPTRKPCLLVSDLPVNPSQPHLLVQHQWWIPLSQA